VALRGTTRSFSPTVRDALERAIRRIVEGVCRACGAKIEIGYERRYPPTLTTTDETEIAAAAASGIVGSNNVERNLPPSMDAEDFAFFSNANAAPISGSETAPPKRAGPSSSA
jgi:metal-dependent amidase/aminoacylase/carboxypeptidase family protein